MPKAIAGKAGGKAKVGAYRKMCDLPLQTIADINKKEWYLTEKLGSGGFGLVYSARDAASTRDAVYAVKIEYEENGPLFTEMHVYQKMAKPSMVQEYLRARGMQFVGVPRLHAIGSFVHGDEKYRFLVLDRCSSDVQALLTKCAMLRRETVATLALHVLEALEYIHSRHYVHADVKAANMMFGYASNARRVYLIDFGLAEIFESASTSSSTTKPSKTSAKAKLNASGGTDKQLEAVGSASGYKHREYVADKRRAHNGTLEFTSRDAHGGYSPSRRGDLEQLGYNVVLWSTGSLNWLSERDPERVYAAKRAFFDADNFQLTAVVRTRSPEIEAYLNLVRSLDYQETPNYAALRQPFIDSLAKLGVKYPPGCIAELDAASTSNGCSSSTPKRARATARSHKVANKSPSENEKLAKSLAVPAQRRSTNVERMDVAVSPIAYKEDAEIAPQPASKTSRKTKQVPAATKSGPSGTVQKRKLENSEPEPVKLIKVDDDEAADQNGAQKKLKQVQSQRSLTQKRKLERVVISASDSEDELPAPMRKWNEPATKAKAAVVEASDSETSSPLKNKVAETTKAKKVNLPAGPASDVAAARKLLRKSISTLHGRSGSAVATRTRARATQRSDALANANANVADQQVKPMLYEVKNSANSKERTLITFTNSPKRAEVNGGTKRKRTAAAKHGAELPANDIIPGALTIKSKAKAHFDAPVVGSLNTVNNHNAPVDKKKRTAKNSRPANDIIPGAICLPPARKVTSLSDSD